MTINFDDSVKQEIWATVRAMNDAWTKGNPDDLAKFFHRDMVAITATDRNRLDGGAACIAGWKGFATAARIHCWEEVDPVSTSTATLPSLLTTSTCPLIWVGRQSTWEAETCFSSSKKMAGGGLLQISSPHTRPNPAFERDCAKARSPSI